MGNVTAIAPTSYKVRTYGTVDYQVTASGSVAVSSTSLPASMSQYRVTGFYQDLKISNVAASDSDFYYILAYSGSSPEVWRYNNGSPISINASLSADQAQSIVYFQGNLYAIVRKASNGLLSFYKYNGSTWSDLHATNTYYYKLYATSSQIYALSCYNGDILYYNFSTNTFVNITNLGGSYTTVFSSALSPSSNNLIASTDNGVKKVALSGTSATVSLLYSWPGGSYSSYWSNVKFIGNTWYLNFPDNAYLNYLGGEVTPPTLLPGHFYVGQHTAHGDIVAGTFAGELNGTIDINGEVYSVQNVIVAGSSIYIMTHHGPPQNAVFALWKYNASLAGQAPHGVYEFIDNYEPSGSWNTIWNGNSASDAITNSQNKTLCLLSSKAYLFQESPSTITWNTNSIYGSLQYATTTAVTNKFMAKGATGTSYVSAQGTEDALPLSTPVYVVNPTISITSVSSGYVGETINVLATGSVPGDPATSWTINWYVDSVLSGTSILTGGSTSFSFTAPSTGGYHYLKAEFADYTSVYIVYVFYVSPASITINGDTSTWLRNETRTFTSTGHGIADTVTWSYTSFYQTGPNAWDVAYDFIDFVVVAQSNTSITLTANYNDTYTGTGYIDIIARSTVNTSTYSVETRYVEAMTIDLYPASDIIDFLDTVTITGTVHGITADSLNLSWSLTGDGSLINDTGISVDYYANGTGGSKYVHFYAYEPIKGFYLPNSSTTYDQFSSTITVNPVSIVISGNSNQNQGSSQTLSVSVSGIVEAYRAVTWSIDSGGGTLGVPSGNTISYTAPHGVGTAGTKVIKASLDYAPANYGTFSTLVPTPTVSLTAVTVSPYDQKSVNVQPYSSSTTGTSYPTVTWSVVEAAFATHGGTINSSTGVITQVPYGTGSNGTYTVKATLNDYIDNSIYGTATFAVNPVTVTLTPTTKTADQASSVAAYTATVTGIVEAAKTVTWSVDGATFGAKGGTINASSGAIVTPYLTAAEGNYIVRATNTTDTNGTGTATLTVQPIAVSLSPTGYTLDQAQTATPFTATVTGTSRTSQLTWSINTNGSVWTDRNGVINSSTGQITSPYGWNSPNDAANTYQIKAVHNDDATKYATTNLTVRPITISLSPKPGGSIDQKDTAAVTTVIIGGTTRTGATWTVTDAGITHPTASFVGLSGSIVAATGVVTAPYSQGTGANQRAEGDWTINVVHDDDSRKTDTTTFSVNQVVVEIEQGNIVRVDQEDTTTLTANVTGTIESDVTWSIEEAPDGGAIVDVSNDGQYTAPAQEGQYHVIITHADDPAAVDRALVVVPPIRVSLIPSIIEMDQSDTHRFSARVVNHSDKTVVWTATGASAAAPGDVTDKWLTPTSINGKGRYFFGSTIIGNRMYVLGGIKADGATNEMLIYDLIDKTWSRGKPFEAQTSIVDFSAVAYDGKMYVFGGAYDNGSGYTTLATLYEYDPQKDSWTLVATDSDNYRRNHAAVVYNGKMYLHGGITTSPTPQYKFRYFDFITASFYQIDTLSSSYIRGVHSAIGYSDKLYIIKGNDVNAQSTNSILIYDLSAGTWSSVADTQTQKTTQSALYGTDIYIYGGGAGHTFRKFDLLTNTFSALADIDASNHYYGSLLEYDGLLYSFSGSSETNNTASYLNDDLRVYDIVGDVVEYTSSATRGTYYLTATTNAPGSLVATSKIVVPAVIVAVSPEAVVLDQGQNYNFSADVENTTTTTVEWSLVPSAHGTLDGGTTSTSNPTEYVAPTIPGLSPTPLQNDVRVVVTTDDDSVIDYSEVTLRNVTTNLNATSLTLAQGETYQFYAWINGSIYPWSHESTHSLDGWDCEDIIVGTKWYIYRSASQAYLIYDFSGQTWSISSSHSTHVGYDSGLFTYGGNVYRYGGGDASYLNRVSKYIVGTDSWASDVDISGDIYRRRDFASVFYNNKFYIFGGNSSTDGTTFYLTDHCFYYNPATNNVTDLSFKTPLPVSGRAVLIGSVVYLIGRFIENDGSFYYAIYSRDLASGTSWTRLEDPPLEFAEGSRLAVVGTLIYCVGPTIDIINLGDTSYGENYGQGCIYDTTNDNWYSMSRDTNKPKIETPFAYYATDGKIYSFGSGRYGIDDTKELRSYDLGNFGMTWAIREGGAGGTISGTGLYTPGTTAGTYHIDVYTPADTTAVATATVTVSAITIEIYPSSVTLNQREQYLFAANVAGTINTDVIWSVQAGGVGGTINSEGVYRAPQTAGTDTIVATSVADGSKTDTATVTVSGVTAQVEPSIATVLISGTQQFRCAIQGNNVKTVTWSAPDGGSINGSGVFTAPAYAGTFRVRATTTVGSIVAEAVVNVVSDVYWENRIGLLLANNPFELCGVAEFNQPIAYRTALAKTLAKALGGQGIHGGGAKEFSLLGPQRGNGSVNKTKYPPTTMIIYDSHQEAWFFRTTTSTDITFSDSNTTSANLFAVASTDTGAGYDFIKGAITDVNFIAQDVNTAAPANSILLGIGAVVNSEFTTFTANYDVFIEDVVTLFTLDDTASAFETYESGNLLLIDGGEGTTVEALTENVNSSTVQNAIVNVDISELSGLEFDLTEALKVKIKSGDGILINTLDYSRDGSLFSNLNTEYYGYIMTNNGTLVLQNGDDLAFTGVDAIDTAVSADLEGSYNLTVSLKDTIDSQIDWMNDQVINSFFDIQGGLAIGSYVISPTDFSDNRDLVIPDPGSDGQYINTSGPYLVAHIDLTGNVNILADDTETAIEWNEMTSNVNWNDDSIFDATYPDTINLLYPGMYLVLAQIQFEENSSDAGTRELRIEVDDGVSEDGFGTKKYISGKTCTLQAHSVIMIEETASSARTVKVKAYQDSGDDVYLGDTGWIVVLRLSVKSSL